MTKTERLDELFEKWENKKNEDGTSVFKPKGELGQFVRDGIVCPEIYLNIKDKPRILFILKDPNNGDGDYDKHSFLEEIVQCKNSYSTWNEANHWAGALYYGKFMYTDIAETDERYLRPNLRNIAVMNIKKASGRKSVGYSELEPFAINDRVEIIKEIQHLTPDIIIACSRDVFLLLQTKVFKVEKLEDAFVNKFNERMKSYGRCFDISSFIDCKKPVYIVAYRHPNQAGTQGTSKEHYENMLKIREHFFGK